MKGASSVFPSHLRSRKSRDIPLGPHGAASMGFQQKEFDGIMAAGDVTKPPNRLDPVIGKAFVPDDNAMTLERVKHTSSHNEKVLP